LIRRQSFACRSLAEHTKAFGLPIRRRHVPTTASMTLRVAADSFRSHGRYKTPLTFNMASVRP